MSESLRKAMQRFMEEGMDRKPSPRPHSYTPIPSLIQPDDWDVIESDFGKTNKDEAKMWCPFESERGAAFTQLDEMSHVAFSPPNPGERSAAARVSLESVLAAEDWRMRERDYNAGIDPESYMVKFDIDKIKEAVSSFMTAKLKPEEEWRVAYGMACNTAAYFRMPRIANIMTRFVNKLEPIDAAQISRKKEMQRGIAHIQEIGAWRGHVVVFDNTIQVARHLDKLRKDNGSNCPVAGEPVEGFPMYEPENIHLDKSSITFRVGDRKIYRKMGAVPKKWTVWPTTKRVFEKRIKVDRIAIALDCSGSMKYTLEDFNKFFRQYPAAKILAYSGDQVLIVGNEHRYADPKDWTGRMPGANETDFCAMTWLAEQDVDQRYFVSDGEISFSTTLEDHGIPQIMKLFKDYNIRRVSKMEKLVPVVKGTRNACKFPFRPRCLNGYAKFAEFMGKPMDRFTEREMMDDGD